MFKNLNIFIVSIACCLTMPGLAETYSIYLGDYGIKLIESKVEAGSGSSPEKKFSHAPKRYQG